MSRGSIVTSCDNIIIMTPDSPGLRSRKRLPFLQEILSSRQQHTSKESSSQLSRRISNEVSMEYLPSLHDHNKGEKVEGGSSRVETRSDLRECIKSGQLAKTSYRHSEGSKPGPTRLRHFRLTEEALEYFQQSSRVSPHVCL